ncbi:MAG: SAM-dependent methyltransferase [Gemmatimonadota bacterium]|nr:SAM-dependent methyltransferase [Gemmatimonadota bacterium]MDE2865875.1 SAM-dependent methyltransferase [Gemmatimonadota bacterium]
MTLPADFATAHRRHWKDAELLFAEARLGNADHLYGFSAECGLKAVMLGLGMSVDASGKPTRRKHAQHVPDLWPVFETFVEARGASRRLRDLPSGSPFGDWSHHDRYSATGCASPDSVNRHREAARIIRRLVQRAEQEGTP